MKVTCNLLHIYRTIRILPKGKNKVFDDMCVWFWILSFVVFRGLGYYGTFLKGKDFMIEMMKILATAPLKNCNNIR